MKRPMCVVGGSFATGMWVAFELRAPVAAELAVCAAAMTSAMLLLVLAPRIKARAVTVALLSVGLAFATHMLYAEYRIAPFERYSGEAVRIEGVVMEMNRQYGRQIRYTVKAGFPGANLPDATVLAYCFDETEFLPGDVIYGELRLLEQAGASAQRYRQTQGIMLTGSLIPGESGLSQTGRYRLDRALLLLRQRFLDNIYRNLPASSAAFVQGMVMGKTDDIDVSVSTAMQRSGASHLLAVSGIHLTIFSGFVLFALRGTRLSRRAQSLIALACCCGFSLVVGFFASLTRAFVMMVIVILGRFLSRRADTLSSVGVALLVISCVRPYWTTGMGLWLSAAACVGISTLGRPISDALYRRWLDGPFGGRLRRALRAVAEAAGISCGAYLFTMPLLFAKSGWISLLAPFANLLIAPFSPLILIGGILCAVLPARFFLSSAVAAGVHACVTLTTGVAQVISRLPFGVLSFDRFWMLLLLAALSASVALLFRRRRELLAGVLVCFALAFPLGLLLDAWLSRNRVELAVIGERHQAVLLRGGSAVLLTPPDRYGIGELLRYLHFRGVRSIDAVLMPSYNGQIDSGLLRLCEEYAIACVVGPDDDYILSLVAQVLPGVPVYPSGYARAEFLGGVSADFTPTGETLLSLGSLKVFQSVKDYGKIELDPAVIGLYPDMLTLPTGVTPVVDPVGGHIFGETRLSVEV